MNKMSGRLTAVGLVRAEDAGRRCVIESYADARSVLVSAAARVPAPTPPPLAVGGGAVNVIVERGAFLRSLWMWGGDADRHPARHRAGAAALGPASIEALGAYVESRAAELLASAGQAPGIEIISDFARPLVRDALLELFGIPCGARASLDAKIGAMAGFIPGNESDSTTPYFALAATAKVVEDVWAKPLPPLAAASRVLCSAVEAGRLSLDEALAQATLLLFGNSYTTLDALAGLLARFAEQPLLWQASRSGKHSVSGLIEEGLRLGPPAHLILFRDAVGDIACSGGTIIPAGTRIVLPLDLLNRDPAAFAGADAFKPDRAGPPHLGFGSGQHMCVGLHLARAVIRTGVEALLSRLLEWPAETRISRAPGLLGGPSVVRLALPAGALRPC